MRLAIAAVEDRQLGAELFEVAFVGVPAAVGKSDAAGARFDEAAGGQELLDAAVAVARAWVFAGQVEGAANVARGDHVERAGRERIHAAHLAGGVDVAADGVEILQKAAAVAGAVVGHAVGEG